MTDTKTTPVRDRVVVARCVVPAEVDDVVGTLVEHGADPGDVAVVARYPTARRPVTARLAEATAAAALVGAVAGLLLAAPWLGLAIGVVSGAAAAVVSVLRPQGVPAARFYDVVTSGGTAGLAGHVLPEHRRPTS